MNSAAKVVFIIGWILAFYIHHTTKSISTMSYGNTTLPLGYSPLIVSGGSLSPELTFTPQPYADSIKLPPAHPVFETGFYHGSDEMAQPILKEPQSFTVSHLNLDFQAAGSLSLFSETDLIWPGQTTIDGATENVFHFNLDTAAKVEPMVVDAVLTPLLSSATEFVGNNFRFRSTEAYQTLLESMTDQIVRFDKLRPRQRTEFQLKHHYEMGDYFLQYLRNHHDVEKQDVIQSILHDLKEKLGGDYSEAMNVRYSEELLTKVVRFRICFWEKSYVVDRLGKRLTWEHFNEVLKIDDPYAREFYAETAYQQNLINVTHLKDEIKSKLYNRTIVSRQRRERVRELLDRFKTGDVAKEMVLKDLYLFPYIKIDLDASREEVIEAEMVGLQNQAAFRRELGIGFTVGESQRYMHFLDRDGEKGYRKIDIFTRWRDRPVIIELKKRPFDRMDLGQIIEYQILYREAYEDELDPFGMVLVPAPDKVLFHRIQKHGTRIPNLFVALYRTQVNDEELEDLIGDSLDLTEERVEEDSVLIQELERYSLEELDLSDEEYLLYRGLDSREGETEEASHSEEVSHAEDVSPEVE